MKITNSELVEIKKTKFVEMYHDPVINCLLIIVGDEKIVVPVSKIAQIQRGLLTEVQKYYRKHIKRI